MTTPYIHLHDDGSVEIVGDKDGLEALGHALLLKAKLGDHFAFTMTDGIHPPIKLTSLSELLPQILEAKDK